MQLDMTSPQEFFHKELHTALKTSRLTLSKDLEFYVVNLLCTYIAPENLNLADGNYSPLQTPLAILFAKAVEASSDERLKILKTVGDTSLFVSGFFQDYFNRKPFGIDYYVSIGTSAYANVSQLTRLHSRTLHNSLIYETLALKFTTLVELVAYISDKLGDFKNTDLLMTYERWLENKSDRLLNRLKDSGIVPIQSAIKKRY